MLPSGLVRATVERKEIHPSLVDPERSTVQQAATELFELFRDAVDQRRRLGELLADLDDLCAERRDHRMIRGMAHLARNKCTLQVVAELDPGALRSELFAAAAASGPLALADDDNAMSQGPLERPTARAILTAVGERHGLSADEVADAMYADLDAERRLTSLELISPRWLIDRYNVSLVQSLLLKATEVKVELSDVSGPRLKQLFRWIKFHQLLHRAHRSGSTFSLHLDGPVSMFQGSTRYGRSLGRFFPALCLVETPWRMQATVLWTKAAHRKELVVTHEQGLRSHYPDTGAYRTKTQEHLVASFAKHKSPWRLLDGQHSLQIGPSDMVFPDFTLTDGERIAHLEVWGHWRPEALIRRLEGLERYGPEHLVLAISRRLASGRSKEIPEHPGVIPFAEVLSTKRLIEVAERVAIPVAQDEAES
ncbi:MAG TPA: DUF790 family protein [Deltaproteobacteria bacterium]|nr:DUF790 family protein [Deltaproteobacteria bacterium]